MSMRILLIDGNSSHLDTLTTSFFLHSYAARCFRFAEDALLDYPNYLPHLIVCEPVLVESELRGWEFVHEILCRFPEHHPYLIALANNDSKRNRNLCMEFGFNKFILKPVDPNELANWVFDARLNAGKHGMAV